MQQKYLIVASKKDKAGINITTQLSQFRKNPIVPVLKGDEAGFDFYLVEEEIIHTRNLDYDKINKYDFIIFASKHKSEKSEKTLSVHMPGNWRRADFGGQPERVCKSSAIFFKQIFEKLKANADKYELKDYKVTLEATHHGPLIDKPCIFIEIGSTENEWVNRKAGFIVAKTISDIIKETRENPYNEVAVGIGGPHYCPNFNKIQLSSNVALSHIIPSYVMPITEQMIIEAIKKTEEEVDFVLLDWKGIKTADERKRIIEILDKNYIQHKKTSDIKK